MLVTAQIIIVLIGILIVLLSLWGIAFPAQFMRTVHNMMDKSYGMALAVGVRIILGVSLLFAAPASKFVVLFKALGWLSLVAAAVIPVIGRKRLDSVLDWFQSLPGFAPRLWFMFGVLFGAFILYGISGAFN